MCRTWAAACVRQRGVYLFEAGCTRRKDVEVAVIIGKAYWYMERSDAYIIS